MTTRPSERHRQISCNGLLTVVDQTLSSLGNFGVALMVAQAGSAGDFGTFTLIFGVITIGLTVERSALGVSLALNPRMLDLGTRLRDVRLATSAALVLGLLASLSSLIGAALFGSVTAPLLVLCLASPVVLVQDLWRFVAVASRRSGAAVASDGVWVIAVLCGLAWNLMNSVNLNETVCLVLWTVGAVAALLVMMACGGGVVPATRGLADYVRDRSRRQLGAEGLVGSASPVVVGAVVTLVASTTVLGAYRGASTLLGPLNVLAGAVVMGGTPEAMKAGKVAGIRLIQRLTGGFIVATLVWGSVLVLLPTSIGVHALGQTWVPAHKVLPIVEVEFIGTALWTGALTILRLRGRTRAALYIRLVYATLTAAAVGLVTWANPTPVAPAATLATTTMGLAVVGMWCSRSEKSV